MSNRFAKIFLIIVTIISVFLMIVTASGLSLLEPVRIYVGAALTPMQSAISSFGSTVSGAVSEHVYLHDVYEENEELKARLDALTEENNRLKSDELELARLRELYELDQEYMQYPKVAARVIAKSSRDWFSIFKVDKGLADGITVDMNVICGGGLLGIVTETGPNYSIVRAIIDDESNIYAESLYSGDTCLVKGSLKSYEDGKLDITNISKDAVFNDGDTVVTSNLSTKYLPGLLIGYASDISIDSRHLTKSGRLIPAADFDNIKEVLILTMIKTDSGLVEMGGGSGSVQESTAESDGASESADESGGVSDSETESGGAADGSREGTDDGDGGAAGGTGSGGDTGSSGDGDIGAPEDGTDSAAGGNSGQSGGTQDPV